MDDNFSEELGLRGKCIVIAGGANGAGRAVSLACARAGARIVIGDRDEASFNSMLSEYDSVGADAIFVKTDLRDLDACEALFDTAMSRFGAVNGFFCYAGITTPADILDCTGEIYDEIFDVNVRGTFFCCQHAIKCMKAAGGGSIVLTGSPHAWHGEKDRAAYACSKGALLTLTNHLAHHYSTFGIRVNLITMGWTATEGELALREAQGMSADMLNNLASSIIPMGRMTSVGDIVASVSYLLGDNSRLVTGSNIKITGGLFL